MRLLESSLIFAAGCAFALFVVDPWPGNDAPDVHWYRLIAQVTFFGLLIASAIAQFVKKHKANG